MRKSLVLTDESARHPFLVSLPPHVRAGTKPISVRTGWAITQEDVQGFMGAYVACLIAVLIFIA